MSDEAPLPGALRLPDGSWVRGRGLRHPRPNGPLPGFGLYLGSTRLRHRHDGGLEWEAGVDRVARFPAAA
ncbi:hypothetical protein [Streptomyces antimycoticus]